MEARKPLKTPFFDELERLSQLESRFFVPGHKGSARAVPPLGPVLRWDLTEIEGAGDLSHPGGALAASEANMTAAYGSGATLYSAAGSTSCVQALFSLFVKPGGPVLMARGCHAAALRALGWLGATPLWLPPTEGRLAPATLEAALRAHPGAPVYLTSPDYFGRTSDIAALAALCRRHGSALLVDNAQGAHLRFGARDLHPLTLGADGCADSAHKTLPCLTPAALLHLRDSGRRDEARRALNLFSSTSPAYPVLASLDLAAGLLLESPPDFAGAARRLAAVAAASPHLCQPCDDPLRLVLHPAGGGWPFTALHDALLTAGLPPEYADGERIVLLASPYNEAADFDKLRVLLSQFEQRNALISEYKNDSLLPFDTLPEAVCSPREALLGERERLPVDEAVGRVVAEIATTCPPGVPLLVPGERIDEEAAQHLAAGGILELDVVK